MKKSRIFSAALIALFIVFSFSCQTIKEVFGTPSLSLESVAIKSLDLEGITFKCNYAITNPYPVGITIKEIAANILCSNQTFTKLVTDNGVSIAANGKKSNALNFKIPYTAILNFAKAMSGKTALPFTIDGSASLDLAAMTGLELNSLTIPFTKSFDVPVFKPSFSVSNIKIERPSFNDLKNALINGGMNITKATQLATSILAGQQLSANAFDGIDLNLNLTMDLAVSNSGSSAWQFLVKNCSLLSDNGSSLASLSPAGNATISSASGTVPLKASVNTLQAGAFIASILNKKGTNPTFALESGLSFPGMNYAPDLPLSYTKEIPLSTITMSK